MTDSAPAWTRSRWAAVGGGAVAVHVLAAWALVRPGFVPVLGTAPSSPGIRWIETRPDPLSGIVVSPTRFALPSASAFSVEAAQALPRVAYEVSPPRTGTAFLGAGADGARLGSVPRSPEPRSSRFAALPAPEGAPPSSRIASSQGLIELQAPASVGLPIRPTEVPPWNGPESPQPTRIEFAVNPDGSVVTARTTLSSGSRDADAAALAVVRSLRFPARSRRGGLASLEPDQLVWALATLHPVAATTTNATPQAVPSPATR